MKKLIFLILTLASLTGAAQYRDLHFEHLNVANGLPESFVEALHQDKLGYIWIGTQNGLVRYDGYRLKVYKLGIHEKDSPQDFGVQDIYEDKNDVLWICSRANSVFRYDRANDSFQQYRLAGGALHSLSLSLNQLIGDNNDNLWIYSLYFPQKAIEARYNLLWKLNTRTGRIIRFPYIVVSAVKTKAGPIWFGTNKGLVYYNPSTHKMSGAYLPAEGVGEKIVAANLYEAPSNPGVLWFTLVNDHYRSLGLFSFNTQSHTFKKYSCDQPAAGDIATDTVYTIREDSKQRLWFGTFRGLSCFDRKSGLFTNYTPPGIGKSTGENSVSEIIEGAGGKLWLATTYSIPGGHGLLLFDPSTGAFQRYEHDEKKSYSLTDNTIWHLMVDHSGVLWAGMAWGGLDRINDLRSQFDAYQPAIGDPNAYPAGGGLGITQAGNGRCWLGSAEGLISWQPNTQDFKRVKLPPYIKPEGVNVYTTDSEGLIWCSSVNVRIFTYNPKTGAVDTLNYPGKWPAASNVMTVYQDHSGIIWMGSNGSGLYSYQKGSRKFNAYPFEELSTGVRYSGNKLDQRQVRIIYEDKQGVLWIGTNLGGLNRFNRKDGTFKSYFDKSKGFNCVDELYEDDAGRFWAGTYLSGLFLFDRKTGNSTQFSEKDGLLHDGVMGLLEDADHDIWVPGGRGLTRIDPATYAAATFTTENALPFSIAGNRYLQSLKTPDNQFIFAAPRGLLAFYPRQLKRNVHPPDIYIESLSHSDPQSRRDNTVIEILFGKTQVELPHNQNRLTFNYVALHYKNPSQNKYAYQLAGYDKNWVQAGAQRSVTYTNLAPGTYTFRVKAANSDGVWNKNGASFTLIINPPWWQTWWAYLVFLIIFVAAIWGIIYFRSRNLLRAKRQLEQKVKLRTQEVLEQKEEIAAQRDSLEHTLDELQATQSQLVQREKMASLGELTAGIAHEIQNPLNFVNNFSEVNKDLLVELKDEIDKGNLDEVRAIANDVIDNEEKINHHGKRADAIVKGMLQHSQIGSGKKEPANINALADECMRLAYHALVAKDKLFIAEMATHFDEALPQISVVSQDIVRVLVNVFNNAFYAVNQKQKTAIEGYKPEVTVTTSLENGQVVIKIKDNGTGIPDTIKDKIMQPFFTTKPTGEGTGLGLSLTYDMVVKGHGGNINIDTTEGGFTVFTISIPIDK